MSLITVYTLHDTKANTKAMDHAATADDSLRYDRLDHDAANNI